MNDKSIAGAAEIELAQQAAETSGAEKPPARRPRTVPYRPRIDTEQTTVEKDYRLRMPSLKEFRAEQFEERRHLLFPWLREQESCMIYAATGVGKSMFALSAALAIAGGGEFLGWTVDEKSTGDCGWRVLYVAQPPSESFSGFLKASIIERSPGDGRQYGTRVFTRRIRAQRWGASKPVRYAPWDYWH